MSTRGSGLKIRVRAGLTIREDATGLPAVSLSYEAPASLAVRERNFLALSVATLSTNGFFCSDVSGAVGNCESVAPSRSLRLNPGPPPVPGPLAVGGLPGLLHSARRMRRRLQRARRRSPKVFQAKEWRTLRSYRFPPDRDCCPVQFVENLFRVFPRGSAQK